MLSEIPLEMKEHVYQDWMQFHGIHGPRQVKTWSPITIVERANSYLSDVMQWGREYDGGLPFPEVSAGFVAQNGLELAAQGGLLMVEADSDSDNFFPDPMSRPDSVQAETDFQHTTGHTYFALDEEFDIIPLMCFLTQKYYKVICFLEGQGLLRPYQKLAPLLRAFTRGRAPPVNPRRFTATGVSPNLRVWVSEHNTQPRMSAHRLSNVIDHIL
ncbi:hypothetical protein RSOLAG1IB_10716 [Rhizoctonia solani AG-1 IB]|uniref:Uncharacterized protein n=1 Tax=Thanatephorus cucumeris (strain AG1-IB / isolate 7/3/14) TaxID=1108050 RepID=A0A0B7G085_THACB|nr:hypothetical protein RSOLAG1IB_10716 [Rhizoctonia solani AG-1 IB]